jgi:hypothetical protein
MSYKHSEIQLSFQTLCTVTNILLYISENCDLGLLDQPDIHYCLLPFWKTVWFITMNAHHIMFDINTDMFSDIWSFIWGKVLIYKYIKDLAHK